MNGCNTVMLLKLSMDENMGIFFFSQYSIFFFLCLCELALRVLYSWMTGIKKNCIILKYSSSVFPWSLKSNNFIQMYQSILKEDYQVIFIFLSVSWATRKTIYMQHEEQKTFKLWFNLCWTLIVLWIRCKRIHYSLVIDSILNFHAY